MNQNNGKNSLGLDSCFEEHDNPVDLFKKWLSKAEENEVNDPNAVALATSNKNNQPSVRIVLLKGLSDKVEKVTDVEADEYFNSRPYKNKIGAWASSQSDILEKREIFLQKIKEFENKYPDQENVPRPSYWSGWRVIPSEIEFWVDGEGRIHERLNYKKFNEKWIKELLYP